MCVKRVRVQCTTQHDKIKVPPLLLFISRKHVVLNLTFADCANKVISLNQTFLKPCEEFGQAGAAVFIRWMS